MGHSSDATRRLLARRIQVPHVGDVPLNLDLSRRDILKIAGYGSLAAFLAACGSSSTAANAGITATGGSLTVGSNHSDPAEKKGIEAINAAFTSANGGTKLKMNTVDHGTFQNQIVQYLQGTPEDVFTWFSGHRMRFFADKGLVSPVDDVWNAVKGNFTDAFAESVKGNDGHFYGVPVDYYPWAVFYRPSVFQAKGYTVPTNWDDFKALAQKMQKDGLTPIAFADSDGWPAQGTFDILNLRLNGYDFHTQLLTGKQKFTDSKVTAVFKKWAEITPFYNRGFAGMKWQDGANLILRKTAGMTMFGLFLSQLFTNPADLADLDFFPFPDVGTSFDAEKALDAPIDIMMLSKKSPTLTANRGQANAYLEYWTKGSAQTLMYQQNPGAIPPANDADSSGYPALTKKAVQLIAGAKRITQFFDRDSRPDFSGTQGMQSFLLRFLANPTGDQTNLQKDMQSYWDSLPAET
jgi:multiple sugar transport system substrate-binding protein